MRVAAFFGLILTIIFGLLAIGQLDGLQQSIAGSITGPLANLVSSMGFVLLLLVMVVLIGGVVAAFKAWLW